VAAQGVVVVADLHLKKGSAFLHLEKGSALVRRGTLLPPYDTEATLGWPPRIAPACDGWWRRRTGSGSPAPSGAAGGSRPRPGSQASLPPSTRSRADDGEVAGHLHAAAGLTVRGRRLSRCCFVAAGRRLLLPAFGSYAGSLDVLDPAIAGLFTDGFHVALLGDQRVHPLPHHRLQPREAIEDWRRRPGGHWGGC
jgi:metallophosphoesterase superfamily enzyme